MLSPFKEKSSPMFFKNIKNNLEIFENIIGYVVHFKEHNVFLECKKFRK